jgi:hypothetical protein
VALDVKMLLGDSIAESATTELMLRANVLRLSRGRGDSHPLKMDVRKSLVGRMLKKRSSLNYICERSLRARHNSIAQKMVVANVSTLKSTRKLSQVLNLRKLSSAREAVANHTSKLRRKANFTSAQRPRHRLETAASVVMTHERERATNRTTSDLTAESMFRLRLPEATPARPRSAASLVLGAGAVSGRSMGRRMMARKRRGVVGHAVVMCGPSTFMKGNRTMRKRSDT